MQGEYLLGAVLFSGLVSIVFLALYINDIRKCEYVPLFSSEWKGLGGGLGGWQVSRPLVYAVVAVVFGIGALVLVAEKLQHDHAVTVTSAQYEYGLRKQREADKRKYRDADLARQADKGLRPDGD